MDAMTAKVTEFVLSRQRMAAELAGIAEGGKYAWGDNELCETVAQVLSSNPGALGMWTLGRWGVDQKHARTVGMDLEVMAQDPPDWVEHVNWEAVRTALIENREEKA